MEVVRSSHMFHGSWSDSWYTIHLSLCALDDADDTTLIIEYWCFTAALRNPFPLTCL